MADISIRPATSSDAAEVTATVCEAYVHYIERIGTQPGPMLRNYSDVIKADQVHVAVVAGRIVGTMTLKTTDEGYFLENVAVRPAVKGSGIGRSLLQLAEVEARRHGFESIYLSTHELMSENRALYARIGYVEYDHRVINGFPRVFLRKALP
jgi:N-acetylglutamate synthase-like GNAT family acetyltransferase